MSNLVIALFSVSIILNFLLGFFIFYKNKGSQIHRTFFFLTLVVVGWLVSLFLFYIVEEPTLVLWIGRFNFAVVLLMLYYLVMFSLIFPRQTFPLPKNAVVLFRGWILLFAFLTFVTPLVDKAEIITGMLERETVYGPLYFLYILHYLILSGAGVFFIFQKWQKTLDKTEKLQLIYFLAGLILSLVFAFVTNILLPLFGIYQSQLYGPLASLVFIGITAYAISRYYLFNIKILATEIFVAILGLILLSQAVLSDNLLVKAIDFSAFLSFLIFGSFLVRSVVNETEYRQKLELAYKELKKLDEAKSEFISIASHQLRTPLTAIKGYISMILEGSYGDISDKSKTSLKKVYRSNERLIKLVNDLLNLSRIEAGRVEMEKEKISIEEVVASAVETLKIEAKAKNLYLKLEKPKTTIPQIMCDKQKTIQAVLNIIDNAIRYTSEGGIVISPKGEESNVLIEIKDTGEGMDKEELEGIFKSFSRGAAGSKYWTEGTGLGLYVAQKFIGLQGGRVWAESEGKGKGSTFYIELPMNG